MCSVYSVSNPDGAAATSSLRPRPPNTPLRFLIVALAAAIASLPATFGPGPRAGQHQARVDIKAAAGGVRLELDFGVPIAEVVEAGGGELLVRLSAPVDAEALSDLPKRLGDWIDGVSFGFDTVLFKARRNVRMSFAIRGRTLLVELSPSDPSSGDAGATARDGAATNIRVELLKARLLLISGEVRAAADLLAGLAKRYPHDPLVIAALADGDNRAGRWRRALMRYDGLLMRYPENENYAEARADTANQHARRVITDLEWRRVPGEENSRTFRLAGNEFVSPALRLGAAFEIRHMNAKGVRRSGGRVGDFSGVRERGELYARHDWLDGQWLRGDLFVGETGPGIGGIYARPDLYGVSQISIEYRRPNWDYLEGVVGGGIRDKIEVRREHRFSPRISSSLTGFAYRYGLDHDDNMATSVGTQVSLDYAVTLESPRLVLGYLLDAEYRTSWETRLDSTGGPFNPIPLVSREQHTGRMILEQHLSARLLLSIEIGYTVNRFGGKGPVVGGRLAYYGKGPVRLEFRIEQLQNPSDTAQTLTTIGGGLTWRF